MKMIKVLPQNLINQIAAGEVIERPASVIKELMENSIDAGAMEVEIKILDAGKSLISISDNGSGMDKNSLELCVLSHATSKLTDENLFDIHTFGFRGEALPSMVSIARVSILSSDNDSGEAWCLNTEGKENHEISLDSRAKGTTVIVRDLFFATPARLKFLKSDISESEACAQVINRIALAHKEISFQFFDKDKKKFSYPSTDSLLARIKEIFGEEFSENLFEVSYNQGGYSLRGFVGVPTFNKTSSNYQYFFVNNRFVKDKTFAYALKTAYSGLIPPGRFPVAILFLDIPHNEVDVNAHPAKIEIRFKESEKVRNFLVTALRKFISSFGSLKPSNELVENFRKSNFEKTTSESNGNYFGNNSRESFGKDFLIPKFQRNYDYFSESKNDVVYNISDKDEKKFAEAKSSPVEFPEIKFSETEFSQADSNQKINLGTALYQIANTYVISAKDDKLIIVDQHAAAERITLEKLQKDLKLDSQELLLPELITLSEKQFESLESNSEIISKFGIVYERLSRDEIMIVALPSILGACEVKPLINDVLEELENFGEAYSLEQKIHLILSTISCHGSLRAGKKLSLEEMNSLLRQMEKTENIAQCCHGRPSYIEISIKNLDKFFERA